MEELTIKQAQKIVDEWINQFEEGYWPPLSMLASLVEEVGELAREINTREKNKKEKRKQNPEKGHRFRNGGCII
jgi:NTP pyrophosphatase (non-canonical NTP hydrolase)